MALGDLLYPFLPASTGTIKYVATTGSDATGDGSIGNPWASFQKLLDTLTPGQRGAMGPGIYNAPVGTKHLLDSRSGTSTDPIEIYAITPGTVQMRPSLVGGTETFLVTGASSYWRFRDLIFELSGTGSNHPPCWFSSTGGGCHDIEMWNCVFRYPLQGSCTFVQEACYRIHYINSICHDSYDTVTPTQQRQGFYITGDDCMLLNCLSYNHYGYGCQIRNNDPVPEPSGCIVANMTVFNCAFSGIAGESRGFDNQYWNNIVAYCEYGMRGIRTPGWTPSAPNPVRKNIGYGHIGAAFSNTSPLSEWVFDFDGAGDHIGPGDNLVVDPQFVMAPPQVIRKGTTGGATITNTINPTLPTSILPNDVVFLLCNHDQANGVGVINTPAGWTEAAQGTYQNSTPTDVGRAALFWKRMLGGETGAVTVTATGDSGSDSNFIGCTYLVRGCQESGDPFDEVAADYGPGNATINYSTVNVDGIERTVLAFCSQAQNLTPGAIAGYSQPVGSDGSTSGTGGALRLQQKINLSADAPAVNATNGTTDGWATFHVSVRPPDPSAHSSPDFHLQDDSPARGYGNESYCPTFDIDNNPRTVCDAGAYVFNPPPTEQLDVIRSRGAVQK